MERLVLAISAEHADAILDGTRDADHRTLPPARLPAQDDGVALGLLRADAPYEIGGHSYQLPGPFLSLELAVAAGKVDLDVFGAHGSGPLGVPRLERVHECASGLQRFGH